MKASSRATGKRQGVLILGDILEAAGLCIVGVTVFDPESLQIRRLGSDTMV